MLHPAPSAVCTVLLRRSLSISASGWSILPDLTAPKIYGYNETVSLLLPFLLLLLKEQDFPQTYLTLLPYRPSFALTTDFLNTMWNLLRTVRVPFPEWWSLLTARSPRRCPAPVSVWAGYWTLRYQPLLALLRHVHRSVLRLNKMRYTGLTDSTHPASNRLPLLQYSGLPSLRLLLFLFLRVLSALQRSSLSKSCESHISDSATI